MPFKRNESDLYNVEDARKILDGLPNQTCACDACVDMCRKRPCWGTPEDIEKLIDAGYALKFMLDFWCGYSSDIEIVCPATAGHQGLRADSFGDIQGRCVLLTPEKKCEIHHLKPIEGLKAGCKSSDGSSRCHRAIASLWDTAHGRAVVEKWRKAL
jgi:hypothetical protein